MHHIFKEKEAFNMLMPNILGSGDKGEQIIWYKPFPDIFSYCWFLLFAEPGSSGLSPRRSNQGSFYLSSSTLDGKGGNKGGEA